jgi:hypothetical protein
MYNLRIERFALKNGKQVRVGDFKSLVNYSCKVSVRLAELCLSCENEHPKLALTVSLPITKATSRQ